MKATKWIAVCAMGVIGLTLTAFAQSPPAPTDAYKIQETRLGQWDAKQIDPAGGGRGRHWAYVTNIDEMACVVVDGQLGAKSMTASARTR